MNNRSRQKIAKRMLIKRKVAAQEIGIASDNAAIKPAQTSKELEKAFAILLRDRKPETL